MYEGGPFMYTEMRWIRNSYLKGLILNNKPDANLIMFIPPNVSYNGIATAIFPLNMCFSYRISFFPLPFSQFHSIDYPCLGYGSWCVWHRILHYNVQCSLRSMYTNWVSFIVFLIYFSCRFVILYNVTGCFFSLILLMLPPFLIYS